MGNSPDGKHSLVHVLKFILENCDEEFPAFSATDIQAELSAEEININADRCAIYTDIAAMPDRNSVLPFLVFATSARMVMH